MFDSAFTAVRIFLTQIYSETLYSYGVYQTRKFHAAELLSYIILKKWAAQMTKLLLLFIFSHIQELTLCNWNEDCV
jgi:hypothetical protein